MLENKSKSNNGCDNFMAQPLNSGNFFRIFPIELELTKSEVRAG